MSQGNAHPEELVLTEADRAPPPQGPQTQSAEVNQEVLREVKRLADRVGGLDKLHAMIDRLRQARA